MRGRVETCRVLVWDRSTRVFHWCLTVCVALLLITGFMGAAGPHVRVGQLTVGLLVFRLAWGLLGSQTARFADFVAGPKCVLNYLRHRAPYHLGHNPLGGWMVVALLSVLGIQTVTGLVGTGDGLNAGPLAHWVGAAASTAAYGVHALMAPVVIGLVLLHVGAALVYRLVLGQDLIRPMIDGFKTVPTGVVVPLGSTVARAAISWALAIAVVVVIAAFGRD